MLLLNDFYKIIKTKLETGSLKSHITINKDHEILKGHFPGKPVVPGVCMMQITKELLEYHLKKKLRLVRADNMKFLAVLNPNETFEVESSIDFTEQNKTLAINASLFSQRITFFKLKAVLEIL